MEFRDFNSTLISLYMDLFLSDLWKHKEYFTLCLGIERMRRYFQVKSIRRAQDNYYGFGDFRLERSLNWKIYGVALILEYM